jgi:glycosyltransferase involved in cell wall biosynthesis
MSKKRLRVFLGLAEIAGNFSRLKAGLLKLGHDVQFCAPSGHQYEYPGIDPVPHELANLFEQEYLRILRQRELELESKSLPTIEKLKRNLKMWQWKIRNIATFIAYTNNFDAFVFHYGNSFHHKALLVHFDDLFWLRLTRRTVVFLFCGSDSRPAWIDGAIAHSVPAYDAATLAQITLKNARNNIIIEKNATYIVSNVFSSYFFTRRTVSLQAIGNAAYLPSTPKPPPRRRVPVIVHAPSRSDAKGTAEILSCIDELRAEGLEMTINVLQGKKNEEILAALDDCDFVIDQLYSDLPMATFASEAAGFGKPAIVGSYISQSEYINAYSVHGVPPSAICHPSKLKDTIRAFVNDVEMRVRVGMEARSYVERVLAPEAVAQRYVLLFRRKVPKNWTFLPSSIDIAPPVGMRASLAGRLLLESRPYRESDYYLPEKPALRASLASLESGVTSS